MLCLSSTCHLDLKTMKPRSTRVRAIEAAARLGKPAFQNQRVLIHSFSLHNLHLKLLQLSLPFPPPLHIGDYRIQLPDTFRMPFHAKKKTPQKTKKAIQSFPFNLYSCYLTILLKTHTILSLTPTFWPGLLASRFFY